MNKIWHVAELAELDDQWVRDHRTKATKQVIAAATIQGQLAAQSIAPKTPPECERHMVHVNPKIGDKYRSAQYRWEYNADLIDAQIDRCNRFMDW
jgi:hypothetical protein